MKEVEPIWATGPGEILRHGVALLETDSDTNRRLALISIDNSVELIMQTFIKLPKRLTGLDISRRQRDEYCRGFPSLLDGIEEHAEDKISGLDLGEIEYFHRLRNQLYHDGNGLTPERSKVEYYAEIAQKLFEGLFEAKLRVPNTGNMQQYGEFIDTWAQTEKTLAGLSENEKRYATHSLLRQLLAEEKISRTDFEKIERVRSMRNRLVHGEIEPNKGVSTKLVEAAKDALNIALRVAGGIP